MWEFKYLLEAESHVPILILSGIITAVLLALVPIVAPALARLFGGSSRSVGWRTFFGVLLIEYLFCTACMTLFFRIPSEDVRVELTPFWSYSEIVREGGAKSVFEVVHNVLFFIPIGALAPAVFGCRRWFRSLLITLLFGIVVSASIEAAQYFTHLGFCETDDVIHNVAGCIVGWGVYESFMYFLNNSR